MIHKKYIRKGEAPVKECGACGTVWRDSEAAKSMMLTEFSYDKTTGASTTHEHSMKCEVNPKECPFCAAIADEFVVIRQAPRVDRYNDPNFELEILLSKLNELREKLDDVEQDQDVELPPERLFLISEITDLEIKVGQIQQT